MLSHVPLDHSRSLIETAWTSELASKVENAVLGADDVVSSLARLALHVLSSRLEAAALPTFGPGCPSLFKVMIGSCSTDLCPWRALDVATDADVELAANIARWVLCLPQQLPTDLVFVEDPFAAGTVSPRRRAARRVADPVPA